MHFYSCNTLAERFVSSEDHVTFFTVLSLSHFAIHSLSFTTRTSSRRSSVRVLELWRTVRILKGPRRLRSGLGALRGAPRYFFGMKQRAGRLRA